MGMFAEIAIIDYRYRLPTKENKLSFLGFRLQKTNGSPRFPLIPSTGIRYAAYTGVHIV
jgi:hypothetical protein